VLLRGSGLSTVSTVATFLDPHACDVLRLFCVQEAVAFFDSVVIRAYSTLNFLRIIVFRHDPMTTLMYKRVLFHAFLATMLPPVPPKNFGCFWLPQLVTDPQHVQCGIKAALSEQHEICYVWNKGLVNT
jgi:hypothetical protein